MKKTGRFLLFIATTLIPIYVGERIGDWFSDAFFPNHKTLCEFGGVVLVSIVIFPIDVFLSKRPKK